MFTLIIRKNTKISIRSNYILKWHKIKEFEETKR